jgi:hypothetical protein
MKNQSQHWTLQPGALTLADLRAVWASHFPIALVRRRGSADRRLGRRW